MKKLLSTLLLLLIATCLFASDTTNVHKFYLGISATPGYALVNVNHLNTKLGQYGFAGFNNNCYQGTVAITSGNVSHKGYQSNELSFIRMVNTSASNIQSSLSIYQYMDNLNLNMWRDRTFLVHPVIGIGFWWGNLTVTDKSKSIHSIDTVFSNFNAEQKTVSAFSFLANVGIGINKTLGKRFFIGLETGYKFQFNNPGWYTTEAYDKNNRVTDFPKINMGGFYARVVVNFWLTEIVPLERRRR